MGNRRYQQENLEIPGREGAQKQSPKPVEFCEFTIFEANFGNRRASRGGIGVFLSSIGCTAFIFEHPAVLVYLLPGGHSTLAQRPLLLFRGILLLKVDVVVFP